MNFVKGVVQTSFLDSTTSSSFRTKTILQVLATFEILSTNAKLKFDLRHLFGFGVVVNYEGICR